MPFSRLIFYLFFRNMGSSKEETPKTKSKWVSAVRASTKKATTKRNWKSAVAAATKKSETTKSERVLGCANLNQLAVKSAGLC